MKKSIIFLITLFLLISCSKNNDVSKIIVDPGFSAYINAFTSGLVSSESNIKVVLTEPYKGAIAGEVINSELFNFEPSIEGVAQWVDSQTIEFKPDQNLPSGQSYIAKFSLNKILQVPSKYETLKFGFVVIRQRMNVSFEGIRPLNNDFSQQELFGNVRTSDHVDLIKLQESLSAKQNGNNLDIIWEHLEDNKTHNFIVKGVTRGEDKSIVILEWDGKPIGADVNDKLEIELPPLDEFSVMQISAVQSPGLYFSIQFSDPVDSNQDLTGLISLRSGNELRFSISNQEVKAFPKSKPSSIEDVVIDMAILNIKGKKLVKKYEKSIHFNLEKPAVKLIGDGVIMPSTGNVSFPFKAINLKAVNLRVLQVFEHNINQFFQVNQFNGSSQLSRVGRLIYDDVIDLVSTEPIDYSVWNNFSIGLNDIIDPKPGAIYRVMISFEQHQSLYPCADSVSQVTPLKRRKLNFEDNGYFNVNNWFEGYYNYEDVEDPCTPSYYKYYDRSISSNILSSNFGIIAKEAANDTYNITVTDLRTSDPISGVLVEAYNFQNIKIGENKTDKEGVTQFHSEGKPYLLIAKKGKQKGYLRVDQGSALPVGLYDVGGSKIDRGVKGFIYGERGVWRPGDTIYMSFMLEDKLNTLPESHPIIMELFDPMGNLYDKKIKTQGKKGLYSFKFKTESKDPTGKWQVKATVGNSIFGKTLKIETIKPNRIKINYDFDELISSNNEIATKLHATWLYGAPASNLKSKIEMKVSIINTTFDKYEGFSFDDRSIRFSYQDPLIIETKTNSNGIADINFKWNKPETAPGMLKFSFNTKVFENGGDFSQDFTSKKYSPFRSYVGVKMEQGSNWLMALDTEKKHKIAIASVNEYGKSLDGKVTIELYKMDWNWWWEGDGENEITHYINRRSQDLIKTESFNVSKGKSFYQLSFPEAGWGKYLVRIIDSKSGHSCSKTFFGRYSSWNNDTAGGDKSAASALNIETSKDEYNVGEKIEVTVPSGGMGNIFVTIEKGDKIIDQMWVKANTNSTTFTIDALKEMTPNIYVSATLIQPHIHDKNSLPIRMYGVVPVKVYDAETRLEPVITSLNVLQPEKTFNVSVSEKSGKAMAYTLAVVDEGLLSLTKFKTPNAWAKFYAKEALNIYTWDMYNYVMSAQTGKMAPLLAIGGDEALDYKDDAEANRFKPVVSYLGPFFLDNGSNNTHQVHIPNYIGAVRVMVVGGYNGSYGSAEKELEVKQPLMVLATMPRVLGPSEKVKIPINIITMDDRIKNVLVKVNSNDLLKPVGSKQQSITFSKKGEKTIYFDFEVARKLGVAKFKVEVSSGKDQAFEEIELLVRPPNPHITTSEIKTLQGNESWLKDYKAIGIKGSNSASLQISSIPDLNLEKHLKFLIQYPHGCIEQTTSSVFPQLFLKSLIQLTPQQKDKIQKNIIAGLNRLKSFQSTSGGFGYWPGSDEPSEWGTNYAGHFMLEANNSGYDLPSGLLDSWIKFQKIKASNWERTRYYNYGRYGGDLTQAYRLYTLALSGNSDLGAMNRLRNDPNLSDMGAWRLAAAYAIVGRKDVAIQLSNHSMEVKPYKSMSYSFGSDVRDMAMILETMYYLKDETNALPIINDISSKLNIGWHSTQTRAFSLLAIAKYIGNSGNGAKISAKVDLNGKEINIDSKSPIWSIDIDKNSLESGNIKVTNDSENIIFVSFTQVGIPVELNEAPAEKNLKMQVSYEDLNNRPIDVKSLNQGQDFKVIVKVTHPGNRNDYKEVALNQIFPSGWQIINSRVGDEEGSESTSKFTFRDIRDDRVYTYFNIDRGETKTFEIFLNATFVGKYYMPAIFCAPMYDESVQSLKPGKWIEVVKNKD